MSKELINEKEKRSLKSKTIIKKWIYKVADIQLLIAKNSIAIIAIWFTEFNFNQLYGLYMR